MKRRVAISPGGRWLAVRLLDRPAIQVLDLQRDERLPDLPFGDGDFTVTDDHLWHVSDGALTCRSLVDDGRFAETRIASGGRRLTAVAGDAVAVTDGCRPTVVQVDHGRLRPIESRFDLATPVHPLTARRILAPGPRGAIVYDLERSAPLYPVRLTQGTELVTAAAIDDGDGVVVLVRRAGADALVAVRPDGTVIATVPVPRADRIALASSGRVAIIVAGAQLIRIEVLAARRAERELRASELHDLACSHDGEILALFERRADDGRASLVYGCTDEVIAGVGATANPVDVREAPRAAVRSIEFLEQAAPADRGLAQVDASSLTGTAAPEVAFRIWHRGLAASAADPVAADAVLARAVRHATALIEKLLFLGRKQGLLPRVATVDDPLAHLAMTDADVSTLFGSLRGQPATGRADPMTDAIDTSRAQLLDAMAVPSAGGLGLVRIVRAFELHGPSLDQLVLALAPDLDLRLARLCGFLNNDPTLQCPRLGHLYLAVAPDLDHVVRDRLRRELLDRGLIEVMGEVDAPQNGQTVRVPRFLASLAQQMLTLDGNPAMTWRELRLEPGAQAHLATTLARELSRPGVQRLILIEGLPGSGRHSIANAAAHDVGLRVERCDLSVRGSGEARAQLAAHLDQAVYRAKLADALLVVRSDGALGRSPGLLAALAQRAQTLEVPCCLLVRGAELEGADTGIRFVRVRIPRLGARERRSLWEDALGAQQLELSAIELDDVASRYATVTPGRIVELASELRLRAAWERRARVAIGDVRLALREITMERLTGLATRYESGIALADLVFPAAVRDRLHELVYRLRYRQRVLAEWRFGDKAHESNGVSTLFAGPAGTGKTAAAAAIANALAIDLYVVNVASIMSKWVGETEQNLSRVFDEAEASNVALLFDEADSLFGKRSSEQRSSSDRYANLTINYLLTRMEAFSGLAILTTNLESAIDEAFQRRITTRIRFPAAEPAHREMLWRHLLPASARFADDVDLSALAAAFALEGAHIQRALARAAFRVAAEGRHECVLEQADLEYAALAEYEDMGRLVHDGGAAEERHRERDLRTRNPRWPAADGRPG